MTPCPKNEYFETLTDPRYVRVPGDFSISQKVFEEQNGMADMWGKRYAKEESAEALVRQTRK